MIRILLLGLAVLVDVSVGQQHHDLTILEDGIFVTQTVTEHDDLQVYEVPQHGDRLHIIAYLDYRSGLQLIKDVQHQKCQLSRMEQEQLKMRHVQINWPESSGTGFALPDMPIDANSVEKVKIFKLEQQQPMDNTSYLRLELRQACAGLPIYWADSIDEADLNGMTRSGEIVYDRAANILFRAMHPDYKGDLTRSSSCNLDPSVPPNQYQCHANCVHQKCRMSSHSCYYFITCPMNGQVGQNCLSHNLHAQGQCKMCCNDPLAPCQLSSNDGFWRHCNCVAF